MSLIDEFHDHPLFHEDHFGFHIFPHQLGCQRMNPLQQIRHQHYINPFTMVPRCCATHPKLTKSKAIREDEDFQVSVDVKQFQPKEISVKTVDNFVVVEAKHEERDDDQGTIFRHFIRRYTLPKTFNAKDVVSSLSSDGVLTVRAPLPQKSECNERVVEIQQTGPAHLNVKNCGVGKDEEDLENKVALKDDKDIN